MATKRTPLLGLIIEPGLTQSAKDNLMRLDSIGGLLSLQNDDSALIQAIQDIRLQPASPALGGTPGQGVLQLGADGLPCLRVDAYATQFNIKTAGAFRLRESNSSYSLGIVYAVAGGATSDRSLTISTLNSNRSLTLGANLGTAGAGGGIILSLTSPSDQTLTIPTTGTAVLETHPQTLSAKVIDADLNTISNIENADIKALAAIDATKIADGSITNTEFQALNGATSNIQAQLDGKQPTGPYLTALTGDILAAGPGSAAATIQPLTISTAKLQDGAVTYIKASLTNGIVNADINSAAAIQYSKLDLANSIVDNDVAPAAAIQGSKIVPQFGSQQIQTSQGLRLSSGAFQIDLQAPSLSSSYALTLPNSPGSAGFVLTTNGTGVTSWAAVSGTGTVTSVALTAPSSLFQVTGSPITIAGTLDLTLQTQAANQVWAGPQTGSPAQPAFRSLVQADIPTLAPSKLQAQTINRALVSDASGFLSPSITNATEVSYLSGVTSGIQAQINGKQPTGNYITALNGDVTASGPGFATTTIADEAITNAKISNSAAIADTKLAQLTTAGKVANSATTATATNTNLAIVQRDGSGNFAAGTITAALSGNATTATTATNVSGTVAIANGGTGATTDSGARTNLGLGNSATRDVGTSAGTVAAGNDSRFAAIPSNFKADWITADGLTKVVTHSLGSTDVIVQLFDKSNGDTILIDTAIRNTVNQVTLTSSEAPGASGWRVLILALP
jgi:hypothetical protein